MTSSFVTFLQKHGLADFQPDLDGNFHEIKEGNFKGWYVGETGNTEKGSSFITFTLGDWRTGEKYSFIDGIEDLTAEEKKEFKKQQKATEERIAKERAEREAKVADEAAKSFESSREEGSSAYLHRKGLRGAYNGTKCVKNKWGKTDLLIPMKDSSGRFWGYQTIDETGEKGFVPGQKVEGCFFQFGALNDDVIFITEGFATGASVYEATKKPTVVAFNTANLDAVGRSLRSLFPKKSIVFCADDDKFKKKNYGREKAIKASQNIQAQVIFPTFKNEAKEPTDFNDLHVLEGIERVKEYIFSHRFYPPEETIRTENTGFHDLEFRSGREVYVPNIDDLKLFFDRQYHHVILSSSEIVYVWNGTHYEEFSETFLSEFAEKHFDPKPNNHTVQEFVHKIYRTSVVGEDWFGTSTTGKINLQNGIFDVKHEELTPHDKRFGFRYCLPYKYDPDAKAPRWEKFLNDVTQGDKDNQKIIEEFIGYILSGDSCWLQKALVLEGVGYNGKSTLISTILGLIGEDNATAASLAALNSETNRQTLDGKLANLSEENEAKLRDSVHFKSIVDGGRILVRQLYKKPYYMRNRAKLIMSFNELPETNDVSVAFFRRFILIKFRAVFKRGVDGFDPFIEEKLKKEYPGIFNRCVQAYKGVLERQAFSHSKAADDSIKEYQSDLDPLGEWLEEFVELHPTGNGKDEMKTPIKALYTGYLNHLEHNQYDTITNRAFIKKLRQKISDFDDRYTFSRIRVGASWRTERSLKATSYFE